MRVKTHGQGLICLLAPDESNGTHSALSLEGNLLENKFCREMKCQMKRDLGDLMAPSNAHSPDSFLFLRFYPTFYICVGNIYIYP